MLDTLKEPLDRFLDQLNDYWPMEDEVAQKVGEDRSAGIEPAENLMALGAATIAGIVANRALQKSWTGVTGRAAPKNPAATDVTWQQALMWGVVSGAVLGMVRVASRRSASSVYKSVR